PTTPAMFQKNNIKTLTNKGGERSPQNAVSQSPATVTQSVTQTRTIASRTGSARPASSMRTRKRPAGPYLQRRGAIFYFRKRLPDVIAKKCGRAFLCLSLRTPLLSEAMSRAARLLEVLRREEGR